MFDALKAIIFGPGSSSAKPLDKDFYSSAAILHIDGYVDQQAMAVFGLMAAQTWRSKRIVIEVNSGGCEEKMIPNMKALIQKLAEGSDVRLVARGVCASASMFLMTFVPREHRYAAGEVEMWLDAGNYPAELRRTMSEERLSQIKPYLTGSVRKYTMNEALRDGFFSQVLTDI